MASGVQPVSLGSTLTPMSNCFVPTPMKEEQGVKAEADVKAFTQQMLHRGISEAFESFQNTVAAPQVVQKQSI